MCVALCFFFLFVCLFACLFACLPFEFSSKSPLGVFVVGVIARVRRANERVVVPALIIYRLPGRGDVLLPLLLLYDVVVMDSGWRRWQRVIISVVEGRQWKAVDIEFTREC
jgi:hypothetical protein